MSWQHRGFTWKPRSSLTKRKRQWNWLVDFWSRVNEKCADLHKPFISYFFLVGVTVQSAESLSAAIPLGTSTKRANTKRVNHGRSRLFQDAVPSVSFWLRLFPVRGWRTRSLSLVSGLPTCLRCVRGWLMRLLWAYEHDFAAISPFLSERIGTLCRHPCLVLWLEHRTTGWRSGRSEGNSKSKHSHDSSHSLKSGDSIPRRSGWSGVDLGKLRWTCLLPTSPPTASCIFPWLRAPSARTHWHTAGLGPYASMRFPQWAYSHKLREDEQQVLLVTQLWHTRTWLPELISLATAPPWLIPLRKDLLSQGLGTIWHPRPDLWNLHVWLLDGTWQTWAVYHRQW